MTLRDLPNLISVLRMLLVLPILWALLQGRYLAALLLVGAAGFSDGLDGYLAKRYGWESRLGSLLDPIADKLLLVSSYVALAWLELIPVWLAVVVLLRDLLIVGGAVLYHIRIGPLVAVPSVISKLNTLAQILLVVAVIFSRGVMMLPDPVLVGLVYLVLVTTVLSGLDYAWVWGRRLWLETPQPRRDR